MWAIINTETNIVNEQNMVKNPNWQEACRSVGYFTSVTEELNSGLPRTNPVMAGWRA